MGEGYNIISLSCHEQVYLSNFEKKICWRGLKNVDFGWELCFEWFNFFRELSHIILGGNRKLHKHIMKNNYFDLL